MSALLGTLTLSNLSCSTGCRIVLPKNALQHEDNHGSLSIRGHTPSRNRLPQLHQLSRNPDRSEPNPKKVEAADPSS